MSALFDAVQWVGAHLITGLTGVIVGLFLRTILPERLRDAVIYWGNRAKKYWDNENYHIKIAWRYRTDESVSSEEIMSQLQERLRESPNSYDRFEFERDYSRGPVQIKVSPSASMGLENINGGIVQDSIDSILVTYETSPSYKHLTEGLLDLQDADKEIGDEVVSMNFRRQSSAATCDIPARPTLQRLLGEGRLDTLRGESENGAEVDFTSNTIQIESSESTAITSMIKRAIIYYA